VPWLTSKLVIVPRARGGSGLTRLTRVELEVSLSSWKSYCLGRQEGGKRD